MVPDFSAIHLKLQNKMESITDYESRKRKRHAELSASKGIMLFSDLQAIVAIVNNSNF